MSRAGRIKPRTTREWKVFRAGVLEGAELAHARATEEGERFLLRLKCGGIELSTASAEDAERSRVKTPPEFTPQLKRRGRG